MMLPKIHDTRSKQLAYSLILFIAVGFLLHTIHIFASQYIFFDDGISYLAAAGNMETFQQLTISESAPFNTWSPARDWQSFIHPDEFLSFDRINSGLARTSVHSPLYFWLLHIWVWFFGPGVQSGMLLNLLIEALIVLIFMHFCVTVTGSRLFALASAAVWVLSPLTINVLLPARAYPLFTLWAVLLIHLAFSRVFAPAHFEWNWGSWVLVGVVGAAGALTHFYFALIIFFTGAAIALRYLRHDMRRVLFYATAAVFMAVLFALCFSEVFLMIGTTERERTLFTLNELVSVRMVRVVATFLFVIIDPRIPLMYPVLLAFCILIGVRLWQMFKLRPALRGAARTITDRPLLFYLGVVLLGYVGVVLGLYLTFFVPSYGFAPRFVSPLWPVGAMALVAFAGLRNGEWQFNRFVAWLCGLMLLSCVLLTVHKLWTYEPNRTVQQHVIIDSALRGVVVPLILNLHPDTSVFVATQAYLIANPEDWLAQVQTHPATYIAALRGTEATEEGMDQILALLEDAQVDASLTRVGLWEFDTFDLNARSSPD